MNWRTMNCGALALVVLGLSALAPAAELQVPQQYPTIQAAMNVAQIGDEIVLSPGVYQGDGNWDLLTYPPLLTIRSTNPLDPAIVASTIIDCHDPTGRKHGAFGLFDSPTISGLTITGGSAEYAWGGGAISCVFEGYTIDHCVITGNTAVSWGGGIYIDSGGGLITNCVITGNRAGIGGGIAKYGLGTVVVRDSFIAGNVSRTRGGGLDCETSRMTIENCTIVGNVDEESTGGYGEGGGGLSVYRGGDIQIVNSIIWGNTAALGPQMVLVSPDGLLSTITVSHCDAERGKAGVGTIAIGPDVVRLNWGEGNIDEDPCFLKQGPAGSLLMWQGNDYHLSDASPCINAGDPNGDYAGQTDIDGQPRVQQGRIDIGADETDYPQTIVIGTCDTGVTNQSLGNCTTMADEIAAAAAAARNHGDFVSAVARLAADWKQQGLIDGAEKGRVNSCAASSSLPGGPKPGRNQANASEPDAADPVAAVAQVPACGAGFVEPGLLALACLALIPLSSKRPRGKFY